ncbi:MAG: S24 family peptidase [Pseudomonadota bacterium]
MSVCAAQEPFALQVTNDDMAPEFRTGSVIIVDPTARMTTPCFAVVSLPDGTALGQLEKRAGRWQFTNPDTTTPIDLTDVVGVVVQQTRRGEPVRHYA